MYIRPVEKEDKNVLVNLAEEKLVPLYGDQNKAIEGWIYGAYKKKAFVSVVGNKIAGILCLKVDEKKDYIKISTLLILDLFQGSGNGKQLLKYAEYYTREKGVKKIKVTVSDKKPESLNFFLKNGFKIVNKVKGKYLKGVYENILEKEIELKKSNSDSNQKKKDRHVRIKMQYLKKICNGDKILEARANYSSLRKIKANDNLVFYCNAERCTVKVVKTRLHKTVKEMLQKEDIEKLLPGHSFEQALKVYNDIYPSWKVKENNGMLVIEIKKI